MAFYNNEELENLYCELDRFLEKHRVSTLMQVVSEAIENREARIDNGEFKEVEYEPPENLI